MYENYGQWELELYNSQNATQTFITRIPSSLAKNVNMIIRHNNVSDLSFEMDIEAWKEFGDLIGIDKRSPLIPLTNEIKVKYNGTYLPHAFEFQIPSKTYDVNSKTVRIQARDTLIKLSRRITFATYSSVDSAAIPRQMIDATQSKTYGDFGITFGNEYTTGVLTDRQEWTSTGKVISDAIRELSDDVSGGFDFYFDHDWQYYSMAKRGSVRDKVFKYGAETSNTIGMEVPDDGTGIANSVYIVGQGIGDPVISDPYTDSVSAITYGLSEKILVYSDATLDRANQIAQREVRDRKDIYDLPTLTVDETQFNPTQIYIGDTLPIQCLDPTSPYVGNGRIKEIKIGLSENFFATFGVEFLKV